MDIALFTGVIQGRFVEDLITLGLVFFRREFVF
jgi:hypothetical protein